MKTFRIILFEVRDGKEVLQDFVEFEREEYTNLFDMVAKLHQDIIEGSEEATQ